MKVWLVILLCNSTSAFTQTVFDKYGDKTFYTPFYGKCVDARKDFRHPVQLFEKHNKRCQFYERPKSLAINCQGPNKQYTIFKTEAACKKYEL